MTQPGDILSDKEASLIAELIDLVADLARGNTEIKALEARANELLERIGQCPR